MIELLLAKEKDLSLIYEMQLSSFKELYGLKKEITK